MPNSSPKTQMMNPKSSRLCPLIEFPKKLTEAKSGITKSASLANAAPAEAETAKTTAANFENILLNIQTPFLYRLKTDG
jgi:hypothetical protein